LVYISKKCGSFESRESGSHRIEAGQVIVSFPEMWHRYRPDPGPGWDEYWVGFDDVLARRWVKNCFSPGKPVIKVNQGEKWLTLFTELNGQSHNAFP
jgi:hypothetical protein